MSPFLEGVAPMSCLCASTASLSFTFLPKCASSVSVDLLRAVKKYLLLPAAEQLEKAGADTTASFMSLFNCA